MSIDVQGDKNIKKFTKKPKVCRSIDKILGFNFFSYVFCLLSLFEVSKKVNMEKLIFDKEETERKLLTL